MAIDVMVVPAGGEVHVVRYDDAIGLQSPDSGALVLLNSREFPIAAYAPGAWFMAEEVGSGSDQD